jgi:hypothetical protein
MKRMPTRDTTGKCKGECRNRVREGEKKRQKMIASQPYSTPCPTSPPWAWRRNEQPEVWGGRV